MDHRSTDEMQNYKARQDNIEENLGTFGFDNDSTDTARKL